MIRDLPHLSQLPTISDDPFTIRRSRAKEVGKKKERRCANPSCVVIEQIGEVGKLASDNPGPLCSQCQLRKRDGVPEEPPVPRHIAIPNLKDLKEESGMSWSQLGIKAGISPCTVKDIAYKGKGTTHENVRKIAVALGVSLEELGCEPPKEKKPKKSKRMCRNGHDTHEVGRDHKGRCKECRRIQARKRLDKVKPNRVRRESRTLLPGLRAAKEASGLMWAEVSEKTGLSVGQLKGRSQLDHGATESEIKALAEALNVSAKELKGGRSVSE